MANSEAISRGGWDHRLGTDAARFPTFPAEPARRASVARIQPIHALAAALGAVVVGWALVGLAVEQIRFAVDAPTALVGVEAATAMARLFGALVLFLVPVGAAGGRLRWVAGGLVILSLGGLTFGYLDPALGGDPSLNRLMYASLVVWTVAGALLVVGLVPSAPPAFSAWSMIAALAAVVIGVSVVTTVDRLPSLVHNVDPKAAIIDHASILPGLTAWHWALAAVPLGLATAAVVGTLRHRAAGVPGGWLTIAMVLLAGAQLHNLFWPAPFSPVLTTSNLLRLAFAAVVVVGGVVELRRFGAERAALLAAERDYSRHLAELAVLKADFTAMVGHELGTPIAAIRRLVDVLATGDAPPHLQARTLVAVQAEIDMLASLVADVGTVATAERDDFAVRPFPVRIDLLLADAAGFARMLPGDHPFTWTATSRDKVVADPERIAQVLRNLLANAAKHTPPGTPIELRASRHGRSVRIEVADRGPGIHPDDLARIFEKFGRGRDEAGRRVPGVGLGLYLSRRIVQAHGAELTVESHPGAGSTFGFALEAAG